jgi:hypothetical protein
MYPVCLFILAIGMAGSSDTTITTRHTDFWNTPTGYSYTKVPIPQEPMSPEDARRTIAIIYGAYITLRLTCLCGPFTSFWQEAGRALDATFGK